MRKDAVIRRRDKKKKKNRKGEIEIYVRVVEVGVSGVTKPNIKLGGFRPQLQATYVSSHTEEL